MLVIADMNACFCQGGIVEGTESVEILGIDLVVRLPLISSFSKRYIPRELRGTVRILGSGYFDGGDEVSLPSVRKVPMGSCEPVRMTGLERFSSMKLRAEAV